MTIFEGILIANLVLSLYLAYVTYKQGQDLDEITELLVCRQRSVQGS